MKHNFEKFCKDYENIENYENAAADNFKGWCCHHRKGVDIPTEELQALGMYYNRPASELIFLTRSEHRALHNKGKHHSEESIQKISLAKKGKHPSEETRKRISEANKGENHPLYGKHHSEETKKKIGAAHKGKKLSEKTKKKMSEARKGKPKSAEHKKKISELKKGNNNTKGKHWYNNGKINIMSKECPPGFIPGMLK